MKPRRNQSRQCVLDAHGSRPSQTGAHSMALVPLGLDQTTAACAGTTCRSWSPASGLSSCDLLKLMLTFAPHV